MLWTTVRSLFSPGAWLTEETGATSMLYPFYFTQVYRHCLGQPTLANYSPAYHRVFNKSVFIFTNFLDFPWYWLNIPAIVGQVQHIGQQRGKFRQQKDIILCYNCNCLQRVYYAKYKWTKDHNFHLQDILLCSTQLTFCTIN